MALSRACVAPSGSVRFFSVLNAHQTDPSFKIERRLKRLVHFSIVSPFSFKTCPKNFKLSLLFSRRDLRFTPLEIELGGLSLDLCRQLPENSGR